MDNAQWPDRDRVEEYINNNPGLVSDLLAAHLDQRGVDALNARMFPPPSPYQKEVALLKTRKLLMQNGYGPESALVTLVEAELATVSIEIL